MTPDTSRMGLSAERKSAPPFWPRHLLIPLSILAWGFVLFLTFVLAGHIVETLILLGVAILLSYALVPIVNRLNTHMPRWLAITITYVIFGAALTALILLLVNTLAGEIAKLTTEVQRLLSSSQVQALMRRVGLTPSALGNGGIFGGMSNIAGSIVPVVTGVASAGVGIVVIIVLSIYFVAAGPHIGRWLRTQTPINQRERVNYFLDTVNRIVGGYIRGQVVLAALIDLLVGLGMQFLFHLPFAVLLGLFAFVLEFIPFRGVIVSGAACVLVALTQGFIVALLVLGYFVGIHLVEGEVLGPRVVGRFVGLYPAVELIALLAGFELFGIWGALFAAPVAGIFQALVETFWTEYRRTHPDLFTGLAAATALSESLDRDIPGTGSDSKKGGRRERFRGIFFRHPPRTTRIPRTPQTPAHS